MNHLTIDFETRSKCNLKAVGADKYSKDPSTEVLCLCLKRKGRQAFYWTPFFESEDLVSGYKRITKEQVESVIEQADIVEAHNSGFERALWNNIMVKRLGFRSIPARKWRCSAAKAAVYALPRDLDGACRALKSSIKKDREGHLHMLKMCKPQQYTKAFEAEGRYEHWIEGKDSKRCWVFGKPELSRLIQYCLKDVESEEAFSSMLPDLTERELRIWRLDQTINQRGIYCDVDACQAMMDLIGYYQPSLNKELQELTDGKVTKGGQTARILEYLELECNFKMSNLRAGTIDRKLKSKKTTGKTRRILQLRRILNRNSTSKFKSMLRGVGDGQRLRGLLLYHGASTGRWTGKRIQPQNFLRGMGEKQDFVIELALDHDYDTLELLYDDLKDTAAQCSRGMLRAAPGNKLFCADFSSIEGRVLAWLAGDQHIIDAYKNGLSPYILSAMAVYPQHSYEEIYNGYKANDPYFVAVRGDGKTGELACGYQGGFKAIQRFSPDTSEEKGELIKTKWRENRPATVALWHNLEDAAFNAVKHPGKVWGYRGVKYVVKNGFLVCRLPSGRNLYYYEPQLIEREMPWGSKKMCISYMTVDSETKKWMRVFTYGGKLTNNVVQALARDLMCEGMFRVEAAGYPIVLTVHDEILSERKIGEGNLDEFCKLMSEPVPHWAKGCPVGSDGWEGVRYRK